jgi:hypothetical protein
MYNVCVCVHAHAQCELQEMKEVERIFGGKITENFPDLIKDLSTQSLQ